ncbi:MAG: lytic transglycosylase domain-containing protein [Selenomonadaceae bacterium]|nr:lytic transglycosylase domain-containing protein [Selenomonadaceae bacterium]
MNLSAIGKISSVARVYEIQQRIASIEKNFKIGGDFQATLEREIARQAEKVQSVDTDALKILESQPVVDAAKVSETPEVAQVVEPPRNSAPDFTFDAAEDFQIENPMQSTKIVPRASTDSIIEAAARKFGVDSDLVRAIATAESGIDQSAVSNVGAVGVMQLMPETAANLGVNPYDERENIYGGAHYLRQLLDKFEGNLTQAIAAYNSGPGAVQHYGGVPPYAETQNYVGRVMDIYAD